MPDILDNSDHPALLELRGLTVSFLGHAGARHDALQGVDLKVRRGEVVSLVGGSGSGKTLLSLACIGLLPGAATCTGSILWQGQPVTNLPAKGWLRIRGRQIAMIFQDAQASLNPVYRIRDQFRWVLQLHRGMNGDAADQEAIQMIRSVQLDDAARVLSSYPHELSGGMCQRVMIALALVCKPELLIADEPTSALDRLVQAEIIELLASIHRQMGLSMLLITHDLSMASRLAEKIVVIKDGQIVEEGPARAIFSRANHPYTKSLLAAAGFLNAAA